MLLVFRGKSESRKNDRGTGGLTDEDRRNCALLCLLGKVILYSRAVFMIVEPKVRGFSP